MKKLNTGQITERVNAVLNQKYKIYITLSPRGLDTIMGEVGQKDITTRGLGGPNQNTSDNFIHRLLAAVFVCTRPAQVQANHFSMSFQS